MRESTSEMPGASRNTVAMIFALDQSAFAFTGPLPSLSSHCFDCALSLRMQWSRCENVRNRSNAACLDPTDGRRVSVNDMIIQARLSYSVARHTFPFTEHMSQAFGNKLCSMLDASDSDLALRGFQTTREACVVPTHPDPPRLSGSARWLKSLTLADSPGAQDQRRQEGQQVVRGAEFHAVACRGPPLLAVSALSPLRGPVAPQRLSLSPANDEPFPAADRRRWTNRRAARQGRSWELGVSSRVMSPARRVQPGVARRRRSGARRARCHRCWRRGAREGVPRVAPRARSPGYALVTWRTPAWSRSFTPAFPEDGEGRGRGEEKPHLPVIELAPVAGLRPNSPRKTTRRLESHAGVPHLIKLRLEERRSGER
ncbi:uncharacterized protein LOC106734717 [Tupaia chinensis]|uniref:uncharacterized protein LOC106734717 n=1 Tax=Tupaia chinensis TaxID=246437 RepID=UPI0007040B6A|nr:uncharacterized protein LOC106734717 [Tupaia chinensis]